METVSSSSSSESGISMTSFGAFGAVPCLVWLVGSMLHASCLPLLGGGLGDASLSYPRGVIVVKFITIRVPIFLSILRIKKKPKLRHKNTKHQIQIIKIKIQ